MKIKLNQAYSFNQLGQRSNQEDARYPDADAPVNASAFYVVCDGVGGCQNGEIASRTVCDAFGRVLSKIDWNKAFEIKDFSKALDYAYDALEKAIANAGTSDMATTLTFAAFHKGGVLVAHIGDSRVYQIRPSVGILYRSNDHSLVNALVHAENMTPEEAVNHPKSNVITRSMTHAAPDKDRSSATTLNITDVAAGDYFVLCTDGVLHNIDDDLLVEILSATDSDEEKKDKIAGLCRESTDNNTAYIIPVNSVEWEVGENIVPATIEEVDSEYDDIGDDTSTMPTVQIMVKPDTVQEVSSIRSQSLKDKLTGIFKKYF